MGRAVIRGLPSAMTLGGLLLAFGSIAASMEGRFETAAWLVFAAAMADAFDGAVARGLGVISAFGQRLDSLTDTVSAGVAPAVLLHAVYFHSHGWLGIVISASWVGFVAARLARFDTSPASGPYHFVGVPCPIAGAGLAHYVVFSNVTFGHDGHAVVAAGLIAALGALMLSRVPYWKTTTLLPGQFLRHPYGPGVAVTLLAAAVEPRQALFVGVMFSIVGAAVIHVVTGARAEQPEVAVALAARSVT